MDITILGCRGSYPVASAEVARYGGDTTCLSVETTGSLIILDAGTGLRHLPSPPLSIREAHLFLTHLHWDHILGFPQCPLFDTRPDLTLHVYSLERTHDRFYAALERSVSKPFHRRSFDDLLVDLKFHELKPSDSLLINDEVRVSCTLANHPYNALAFRLETTDAALAFVPDTAPFDRYLFDEEIVYLETSLTAEQKRTLVSRYDAFMALTAGVDWLVYDAALMPAEYERFPHWGHSTHQQAIEMGLTAQARQTVLFHHNPSRSDAQLDTLQAQLQAQYPKAHLCLAQSGMKLRKGGAA